MYKLPERGGGVIRAMPERKHSLSKGTWPKIHVCIALVIQYVDLHCSRCNALVMHTGALECDALEKSCISLIYEENHNEVSHASEL